MVNESSSSYQCLAFSTFLTRSQLHLKMRARAQETPLCLGEAVISILTKSRHLAPSTRSRNREGSEGRGGVGRSQFCNWTLEGPEVPVSLTSSSARRTDDLGSLSAVIPNTPTQLFLRSQNSEFSNLWQAVWTPSASLEMIENQQNPLIKNKLYGKWVLFISIQDTVFKGMKQCFSEDKTHPKWHLPQSRYNLLPTQSFPEKPR